MDGWMDGKAGLRIAYSNQKLIDNFSLDRFIMEVNYENDNFKQSCNTSM